MKRNLVFGAVLCALFLAASPALAVITVTLENPGDGQEVSGISLVSGWAFSDTGAEVTVKPRIDGVTQEDIVIPCCGPRQDVVDAIPGAPLETGFGSSINYGELPAGPHTVGLEISAPGEETVIVDRSVRVVKPGDASFVTTFDLTGATADIDTERNEIVIGGVTIGSDSGTTTDDLRAGFATNSQSLAITDASSSGAVTAFTANLNQDQGIPKPISTSASGSATLTLNADNTLTYNVTTTGVENPLSIQGSAAHIHMAPAGSAGDIIFVLDLTEGSDTDWSGTTEPLTQDQLEALVNAGLYINVHTEQNPAGEIRGQIVAAAGS